MGVPWVSYDDIPAIQVDSFDLGLVELSVPAKATYWVNDVGRLYGARNYLGQHGLEEEIVFAAYKG